MSDVKTNCNHWLGFVFLFICGFWIIVFIYSIHSAMPFNPINLPFESKAHLRFFLPQGWKFFTRNPREEDIGIYAKDSNGEWLPMIHPHSSPINLFGIKKTSRAKAVEFGLLLSLLSEHNPNWESCNSSLQSCSEKVQTVGAINNPSPNPSLCGDILLQKRRPIPWAWSAARKNVIMPSTIYRTNILCD
jgi:antimicrobial peptide system SdpA family protein